MATRRKRAATAAEALARLSPLAAAAIAVSLGDLRPAADLLARRGRTVRCEGGHVIRWPQEHGLPAGGIAAGADPFTALAVMGFALYGPLWATQQEMLAAWQEARKLGRQLAIAQAQKEQAKL